MDSNGKEVGLWEKRGQTVKEVDAYRKGEDTGGQNFSDDILGVFKSFKRSGAKGLRFLGEKMNDETARLQGQNCNGGFRDLQETTGGTEKGTKCVLTSLHSLWCGEGRESRIWPVEEWPCWCHG